MNLAISNIAWNPNQNQSVYRLMQKYWFTGLEIAPKKVFADFKKVSEWEKDSFRHNLDHYEIKAIAMQSLLFGEEGLFLFQEDGRKKLLRYLWDLIAFWAQLGVKSFVFWSPKNRIYEWMNYTQACDIATIFFRELWDICHKYNVYLCIEPNPSIYGWNFLMYTEETLDFVKQVNHKNIKIHIDLGTIIYNKENINIISSAQGYFTHIHISEPHLELIQEKNIHQDIKSVLQNYTGYVSIEMKETSLINIETTLKYIASTFS